MSVFTALSQRAFCSRSRSGAPALFFGGPGGARACFSARLGAPELVFRSLRASIFDRFGWYVNFVKIVVSPRRNHYFSCLEPPKSDPKPRCNGIAREFCQNGSVAAPRCPERRQKRPKNVPIALWSMPGTSQERPWNVPSTSWEHSDIRSSAPRKPQSVSEAIMYAKWRP